MLWSEAYDAIQDVGGLVLPTTKAGKKLIKLALRWGAREGDGITYVNCKDWSVSCPPWREGAENEVYLSNCRGWEWDNSPIHKMLLKPNSCYWRMGDYHKEFHWTGKFPNSYWRDEKEWRRMSYYDIVPFSRVNVTIRPISHHCTLGAAIREQNAHLARKSRAASAKKERAEAEKAEIGNYYPAWKLTRRIIEVIGEKWDAWEALEVEKAGGSYERKNAQEKILKGKTAEVNALLKGAGIFIRARADWNVYSRDKDLQRLREAAMWDADREYVIEAYYAAYEENEKSARAKSTKRKYDALMRKMRKIEQALWRIDRGPAPRATKLGKRAELLALGIIA